MRARLIGQGWTRRVFRVDTPGRQYLVEWARPAAGDMSLQVDHAPLPYEFDRARETVQFALGSHSASLGFRQAIWMRFTYVELHVDGKRLYLEGLPPPDRQLGALDYALIAAVPLALFVYLAAFFAHPSGQPLAPGAAAVIVALFCLVYLAPTWVVLKNVHLEGFLKYFYSLSVVPLFVALFIGTLVIPGDWARSLSGMASVAAGLGVVLLLFAGVPAACWLWYRLLRRIDRHLRQD